MDSESKRSTGRVISLWPCHVQSQIFHQVTCDDHHRVGPALTPMSEVLKEQGSKVQYQGQYHTPPQQGKSKWSPGWGVLFFSPPFSRYLPGAMWNKQLLLVCKYTAIQARKSIKNMVYYVANRVYFWLSWNKSIAQWHDLKEEFSKFSHFFLF